LFYRGQNTNSLIYEKIIFNNLTFKQEIENYFIAIDGEILTLLKSNQALGLLIALFKNNLDRDNSHAIWNLGNKKNYGRLRCFKPCAIADEIILRPFGDNNEKSITSWFKKYIEIKNEEFEDFFICCIGYDFLSKMHVTRS
jgi:hypothetical protein